MKLKVLKNADITGKTVLYRAPYDIETMKVNGRLVPSDDMRIKKTLPTLEYLIEKKCRIIILTYVGRPDGVEVEDLRTTPHAEKLAELLNHPVSTIDDCVGEKVEEAIKGMSGGDILMLENARFHKEEMVDDDEFARRLCIGKDIIVFDGFPQAHRIHASTTGILRHLPSVAGLYLEEEVRMLSSLLESPQHPFTVIIGGAKISDKVGAISNLMNMADAFLVGGAVANVFLKAEGKNLGDSFIEDVFVDKVKREKKDWVIEAKHILEQSHMVNKKIILPSDMIVSNGQESKVVNILDEDVPTGWRALDIGPATRESFAEIIKTSKTIFINGPLGKFEEEEFSMGSQVIFTAMIEATKHLGAETIIAGGDTIDVARKYSDLNQYSHLSLAGGATLEFLAGKELPALIPLLE